MGDTVPQGQISLRYNPYGRGVHYLHGINLTHTSPLEMHVHESLVLGECFGTVASKNKSILGSSGSLGTSQKTICISHIHNHPFSLWKSTDQFTDQFRNNILPK